MQNFTCLNHISPFHSVLCSSLYNLSLCVNFLDVETSIVARRQPLDIFDCYFIFLVKFIVGRLFILA